MMPHSRTSLDASRTRTEGVKEPPRSDGPGGAATGDASRHGGAGSWPLVWVSDVDTGHVLGGNEAFVVRLGYDDESLRAGTALGALFDAGGRDDVTRQLHERRRVAPLALALRARDGTAVACRYSAEEVATPGRRQLVSMAHAPSDDPGDHLEVIGALAGGVAHDLGNVLAALAMTVELLLQGDDLVPEVVRGLLELDGEIRRASRLTRQLLLLGRRRSLEAVPVELNALVDDLSVMLRRLLGDAVSLRVASDADALWISGDASMLEQVVANLVVNARDAMPDGGTVDIRMRLVERPAGRANGDVARGSRSFVMLEVEDTGSGIEPQHVERIFEPYFTTKSEGKGMGIGLATVQGVARQHGGWVEVASVPGRGARFRVMLPAGAPPPAHPAPPG